jgi:hypothetical protein
MTCTVEEIHVGDIGTVFEHTIKDCDVVVDISSATTQEVYFQRPNNGIADAHTTSFKTDGTDGIVQYSTVADDLDEAGTWKIQFHVIMPSGEWHSDIQKFKVYSNIVPTP